MVGKSIPKEGIRVTGMLNVITNRVKLVETQQREFQRRD